MGLLWPVGTAYSALEADPGNLRLPGPRTRSAQALQHTHGFSWQQQLWALPAERCLL